VASELVAAQVVLGPTELASSFKTGQCSIATVLELRVRTIYVIWNFVGRGFSWRATTWKTKKEMNGYRQDGS
jgi:hypothetical protein